MQLRCLKLSSVNEYTHSGMSLGGADALALYLSKVLQNIESLTRQAGELNENLIAYRESLNEIARALAANKGRWKLESKLRDGGQ